MRELKGEEWWSLPEAAAQTGLHQETIRQWSVHGRVRRREEFIGRRKRVLVPADQVRHEASFTSPRTPTAASKHSAGPADVHREEPNELNSVLEEVTRRYRIIEEHHEEIERRHRDIAQQHRDIETMLQGPSRVPND